MAYAFEHLATKEGKGHVGAVHGPGAEGGDRDQQGPSAGRLRRRSSLTLGAPASLGALAPGVAMNFRVNDRDFLVDIDTATRR